MKKILLVAILFTALNISCKKEEVINYSSNTLVTGSWVGKYTYNAGGSTSLVDWSVTMNADGSCIVSDGSLRLDGVYNISENKLKLFAKSTGSFQIKYDATLNNNTLDGVIVWNYFQGATPVTVTGTAKLTKQ